MMRSLKIGIWIAAILAAACSGTALGPRGVDPSELAEIERRVLELQRRVTVADVELRRLRQQVAHLEARLAAGEQGIARSSPGAGTAPGDAARPPSPPPPPEIEVRELEEPGPGLPGPPATSVPLPRPGAGSPPAPGGPAGEAGEPEPITPAAQALYDRGYTLYHQGRYVDAEASFQRFLASHGGTELADNAQYWIGESRFARGDFRGALAAFRETVERYPEGNKVPDALLKAGQSLEEVGDPEGARTTYRELLRRFPGSGAAAAAEERIGLLP